MLPHDAILSSVVKGWLQELCDRWQIPGLSVSVVSKSKNNGCHGEVFTYGRRNAEGQSFEPESIFTIASCSKLFTAVSIGLLIADEITLPNGAKLAWETKLQDILPEWKLKDKYISSLVDLIDLLSMRTGLPGHDQSLTSELPENLVRMLGELPLSAEIRQVRQYSNISYIVASHVVTTLSGMPFTDFVTTRIFDRLGMKDTTYDITRATQSGKRVYSFVRTGVDERKAENAWNMHKGSEDSDIPLDCLGISTCYEWAPGSDIVHNAGAGGIWTTAEDMTHWLQEVMCPSLIPPAVFSAIISAHSIPFSAPVNAETGFFTYGLGTYVHPYRGHKALYHAGGLPGQYSYQLALPEQGIGVLVASNDDHYSAGINKIIAYAVVDALLGLKLAEGDWEKRMFNSWWYSPKEEEGEKAPPPPDNMILGTYVHPGYPVFHVKYLAEEAELRQHLPAIQARTGHDLHLDRRIYHATSPSIFVEDVLFIPHDGSVFTWVATKLYSALGTDGKPTGEKVVAFIDGIGKCVFGEKGLGMGGDWWVSGGKRKRELRKDTNEREFEVWYHKVMA